MKDTPMMRTLKESQKDKGEAKVAGITVENINLADTVQLFDGDTFPRQVYEALPQEDRDYMMLNGWRAWCANTEGGRRFCGL